MVTHQQCKGSVFRAPELGDVQGKNRYIIRDGHWSLIDNAKNNIIMVMTLS